MLDAQAGRRGSRTSGRPKGTAQPGEDSAFFYLPPIDEEFGSPVLGGGDQFVMFDDRPEVRALMEYLATPEAAQGWVERRRVRLGATAACPSDWYTNYPEHDARRHHQPRPTRALRRRRLDAGRGRPGTFWSGMVEWVAADGDDTEEVLADIEESWPSDVASR